MSKLVTLDPGESLMYCGLHKSYFKMDSECSRCSSKLSEPKGMKYDTGKPRMDLLPYDGLVEVAKVLAFGASKYTAGNWSKGIKISRLLAATSRHLGEFSEGRDTDSESSIGHLAHAACNLLFAIWMLKHRPELDDRWIHESKESK